MIQRTFVIQQLDINKEISRNECLRTYISRLGAIVCQLKKEGWVFKPEHRGGDFVYKLIKRGQEPISFNKEKKLEILTQTTLCL